MEQDMTDRADNKDDMEEDKYEDAGELEMSGANQRLYLTRMPKMFWEALSKLHDDDEIKIGTLRVEGDRANPSRVSLILNHPTDTLRYVPKEFNLRPNNRLNANTFVFSERNLPGFTRKHTNRGFSLVSRSNPNDKGGSNKGRSKGHRSPYFRKAIPKKTALVGYVQSEFNCLPIENDRYSQILEQRAKNMPRPKHELQLLEGNANIGVMAAGSLGANGAFNTFIKGPTSQQKKQQQKAIRLPKNELRDLLFECFRAYKFWYMRDLKFKTQQPEPWLRECLEDIAELVRQGAHANTWRLKSSTNFDPSVLNGASSIGGFDTAEERIAPTTAAYDGGSDVLGEGDDYEDDEADIKMENVKIP